MSANLESLTGKKIIHECAQLREKRLFDKAIALIEGNIDAIQTDDLASAWWEAFHVACAKGDTELAKKYMLAIDQADPSAFNHAEAANSH